MNQLISDTKILTKLPERLNRSQRTFAGQVIFNAETRFVNRINGEIEALKPQWECDEEAQALADSIQEQNEANAKLARPELTEAYLLSIGYDPS